MLKNIDARVTPQLLYALARMGHGDTVAIVDANFPAYAAGVEVVHLTGVTVPEAVELVLGLVPLDSFVPQPLQKMLPVDPSADTPETHLALDDYLRGEGLSADLVEGLERFDFYAQTKLCSVVVATSHLTAYGCFIVRKGVL